MKWRLPFLLLAAPLFFACVPSPTRQPTLCELATDREQFAGKTMTVEGELLVSKHGSAVIDPDCDKGVPITWFEDDIPRMKEFDAIAERVGPESLAARVRVTGEMKRAPSSEFLNEPFWYLDLTSAEVLSQQPRGR